MAAAPKLSLNVLVAEGMQPGQLIQATSPEGFIVQAAIPDGLRPGDCFLVEYDAAETGTSAHAGASEPTPLKQLFYGPEFMVIVLVLAGFLVPMILAHARSILHVVFSFALPLAVAAVAVIYDWQTLGPTVALKKCALAAAISWAVSMPLFFLGQSFFVFVFPVFGLLCVCMLACSFGPAGLVAGILLLVVLLFAGSLLTSLITSQACHTLIFLILFWCIRLYLKLGTHHLHPESWPGVLEVDPQSEEFRTQRDYFIASCMPWEHKFNFDLSVKTLYRIDRPDPRKKTSIPGAVSASRRLFHGTQWEGAMGIACDGFRLPPHPGMFGKGLYFADCPLKCWRYCFPSKQMSEQLPKLTGKGGFIFMCWVDLGKTREERDAKPELKGYNRSGWYAWLTGQRGAYDSVIGLTHEDGGALRVPEYIVYDTSQARLAYLFEVVHRRRDAPPLE